MPHDPKNQELGHTYSEQIDKYGAAWFREITPMRYMGSVATKADLPSNPEIGDIWDVEDTDMQWIWTGDSWNPWAGESLTEIHMGSIHDVASLGIAPYLDSFEITYDNDTHKFTYTEYNPDSGNDVLLIEDTGEIELPLATLSTDTNATDGLMSMDDKDELKSLREDLTADEAVASKVPTLIKNSGNMVLEFHTIDPDTKTNIVLTAASDTKAGVMSAEEYKKMMASYKGAVYDDVTNKLTLTNWDGDDTELYLEPTPVTIDGSYVTADRKIKLQLKDDQGALIGTELGITLPEAVSDCTFANGKLTFSYIDGSTPKEVSLGNMVSKLTYNDSTNKLKVENSDGTTYELYLEPTPTQLDKQDFQTSDMTFKVMLVDDQGTTLDTETYTLPDAFKAASYDDGVITLEHIKDGTADTELDLTDLIANLEYDEDNNKLIITRADGDTSDELILEPVFPPVLTSQYSEATNELKIILSGNDGTEWSNTSQTLANDVKNVVYTNGKFTFTYNDASTSEVDLSNYVNGLAYSNGVLTYTTANGASIPLTVIQCDKGIELSGNKIQHTNSVTADTSGTLGKVKYDAQGHITDITEVTADRGLDITSNAIGHTNSGKTKSEDLYKITVDDQGHVSAGASVDPITTISKSTDATTGATTYTFTDMEGTEVQKIVIATGTTYTASNGISKVGDNFQHTNSGKTKSEDLYKITVDDQGHVSGATAVSGDKGIELSGNKIQHTNSVTADPSGTLGKVKYDAQGHITGITEVNPYISGEWDDTTRELTLTHNSGDEDVFTISGGTTTVSSTNAAITVAETGSNYELTHAESTTPVTSTVAGGTLENGDSFTVPAVSVDKYGHSVVTEKTYNLPTYTASKGIILDDKDFQHEVDGLEDTVKAAKLFTTDDYGHVNESADIQVVETVEEKQNDSTTTHVWDDRNTDVTKLVQTYYDNTGVKQTKEEILDDIVLEDAIGQNTLIDNTYDSWNTNSGYATGTHRTSETVIGMMKPLYDFINELANTTHRGFNIGTYSFTINAGTINAGMRSRLTGSLTASFGGPNGLSSSYSNISVIPYAVYSMASECTICATNITYAGDLVQRASATSTGGDEDSGSITFDYAIDVKNVTSSAASNVNVSFNVMIQQSWKAMLDSWGYDPK